MALLSLLHEDNYFDGGSTSGFLTVLLFYLLSLFGKIEKYLKGDSSIKICLNVLNKYLIGDGIYQ